MSVRVWVALILCTYMHAAAETSDASVGLDSYYCRLDGGHLMCDFRSLPEKIDMTTPFNSSVGQISVVGARKLYLSEALCVNIRLVQCPEVLVVRAEDKACIGNFSFEVHHSYMDRIPTQANIIMIESTLVASLNVNADVANLTVVNSVIDNVDLGSPLRSDSIVHFKKTTIKKLEKIENSPNSLLTLDHTTIEVAAPKSLIVHAHTTIKDSSIYGLTGNTIVMNPSGSISFENCNGKFIISSAEIDTSTSHTMSQMFIAVLSVSIVVVGILSVVILVLVRRLIKYRSYDRAVTDIIHINNSLAK